MRVRTAACIALAALLLATLLAVALAEAPFVGAAAAAGPPRSSLSFHPRFRVVAGAGQLVSADGRYALIAQESHREGGTIIDEGTGRMTPFKPPSGCDIAPVVNPLGGRWVAAGCGMLNLPYYEPQSYELYNIRRGTWRALMPNLTALEAGNSGCSPKAPGACSAAPVAIGGQWMEFSVSWTSPHRPPPTYAVQNVWTGQVRQIPPQWLAGGTTVVNLNSPQLAQKLCRPVSLPKNNSQLPGTATIEGSFVISTGMVNTGLYPFAGGHVYIQRCGSKRRVQIDAQNFDTYNLPLAANAHAVVWGVSEPTSQMTGLLLPSLRRFTLRAPSAGGVPILTDRRLYFGNESSRVWRTVNPFPPPTKQSGPHH